MLTRAWISRDMQYADPPVIANGIVFGYRSGEDRHQSTPDAPFGMQISYPNRIAASAHATLYALDGETGKELWFDGMLYCFGLRK